MYRICFNFLVHFQFYGVSLRMNGFDFNFFIAMLRRNGFNFRFHCALLIKSTQNLWGIQKTIVYGINF